MSDKQSDVEAMSLIDAHINKSINDKLAPIVQMLAGLELSIVHVFNMLHRQDVLDR